MPPLLFVRRVAAGRGLIGGDGATVATYTADGIGDVRTIPGVENRFDLLSGTLDDLAVLVEVPETAPLCGPISRRIARS
jgi:hypothetical protein